MKNHKTCANGTAPFLEMNLYNEQICVHDIGRGGSVKMPINAYPIATQENSLTTTNIIIYYTIIYC